MGKREFMYLIICTVLMAISPSCKKYFATDLTDNQQTDGTAGSENANDYIWDNSKIINIVLNGNSITADNASVSINSSKATITSAGTYSITGSLTDGQIIVNTQDTGIVRLILKGSNIICSSSAPVFVKKAKKTLIVLTDNTSNFITDGTSYILDSNEEPNAAVFSKSYLSFYGDGSLTVKANYKDGITSKDGLLIKSGKIDVSSADDGIRGKDYVIIKNGNIAINAKGDGLKSDNDEDPSLGYITIDSAVVNVTASGDGINAQTNLKINDGSFTISTGGGAGTIKGSTDEEEGPNPPGGGTGTSGGYSGTISEKALKAKGSLTIEKGTFIINAADDAIHSNDVVTINGGILSIATGDDAIHAETSVTFKDGTLNISKSYEGIESASITINSGNINLVSTNDGFNATKGLTAGGTEANDGSSLIINGGNVTVNCTSGDGVDSNGNFSINGGIIIVHGPQSQPEVGFDINGTFSISGGFVIGTGPNSGNMIEGPSTTSAQYSLKATISSTISASTLFHIQDSNGNNLVTFKPVRATYYIVFSSPDLTGGSTYSIYTGGSSTGTNMDGIFIGGTYSGGTLKKSFAISGKLTNVSF
jgi:hypothetical protein